MYKVRGRFLALLLVVAMVLGSLPVVVWASGYELTLDEDGVQVYENEYAIEDLRLDTQGDAFEYFTPGGISEAGPPDTSDLIDPMSAPTSTPPPLTLPSRWITPAELDAWVANYHDRGGINWYEEEIVRLVNIERARYGLNPLTLSPIISMAARFKSQEMADLNYFSHDSPIYGQFTGISWYLFGVGVHGENIGRWQRTPAIVVEVWMNSPGHRSNILNPTFVDIGVGACRYHWTQKFSRESTSHMPVPAPSLPDGVIVDSWEALRAAVNAAPVGVAHTIHIGSSFAATGIAITIPTGRNITLISTHTGPSVLNVRVLTQELLRQRHFIVGADSNLTLGQNIHLMGGPNTAGGVDVHVGGELIMNYGSLISNVHINTPVSLTHSDDGVAVQSRLTMRGGAIRNNFANAIGAVNVSANSLFVMYDGVISENRVRGGENYSAVSVWRGTFRMYGGSINGSNSNGVNIGNDGVFTMNGGSISDNTRNGVRIHSGTMIMNDGTIGGNEDGGVRANGVFYMTGGQVSGNAWAGVDVSWGGVFTMSGGVISDTDGTGVLVGGSLLNFGPGVFNMISNNARIENNHNPHFWHHGAPFGGGGINAGGGYTNITAGVITGNSAVIGGGVISGGTGSFTMTGGYMTDNHATRDGGGIYVWGVVHTPLVPATAFNSLNIGPNVTFYGNTAGNGPSAPPLNYANLTHIATRSASIWGHPINNYDINYTGRLGEEHGVSSWEALRAAVNAAPANTPTTIYILTSFYAPAPAIGNAIVIPANRQITLVSSNQAAVAANVRILDQENANQAHFIVDGSLTLGRNITLRTGTDAGGVQVGAGSFAMGQGSAIIGW
ncbi:MAG: CAP domain-containing protein [Defluviitaleaceae bacterium]|nr:CAP domain-containing protein [Defluviitaleaceae bacterium]